MLMLEGPTSIEFLKLKGFFLSFLTCFLLKSGDQECWVFVRRMEIKVEKK